MSSASRARTVTRSEEMTLSRWSTSARRYALSPLSPDTRIFSSAMVTRCFSINAPASATRARKVSTTAAFRVRSSVIARP